MQASQEEQLLMRGVLRVAGEEGFKRFRKLSSKFAKGKVCCDDYAAFVLPLFASDESLSGMRSVLLSVIRDEAQRAELAACFERGDDGAGAVSAEAERVAEDAALVEHARERSNSSAQKRRSAAQKGQQQSIAEAMMARLAGGGKGSGGKKTKKKKKNRIRCASEDIESPSPRTPAARAASPSPAAASPAAPMRLERTRQHSDGNEKSRALFREYDVDVDGFLNVREMQELFAHLNPSATIQAAQIKEVLKVMATIEGGSRFGLFGDADAVSLADFCAWHSKQMVGRSRAASHGRSRSRSGSKGLRNRHGSSSSSGKTRTAVEESAAALPIAARALTAEERAEATALFKSLDSDANGHLEPAELEALLSERLLSAAERSAMLEAIDVDGSGTVELDEFGCWLFRVQRWGASIAGDSRSGSAGRKKSSKAKDKKAKRKSTSAKAMADGGATLRDLQALLQASGFGSDAARVRKLPSNVRAALQSILASS